MKLLNRLLLTTACLIPFATLSAQADDRRTVSAANNVTYEVQQTLRALFAPPKNKGARPAERLLLNNTVNRYEGMATIREEFTSPAVFFHVRYGQVRPGHAWDEND